MRSPFFLAMFLASWAGAATYQLPADQPVLTINIPATWKTVQAGKSLKTNSQNGEVFLSVNGPGRCEDLFKEATEYVELKGVQINRDSLRQARSAANGLNLVTLTASGSYAGTPAIVHFTVIDLKDGIGFVVLQVSSPAAETKLAKDLGSINGSLMRIASAPLPTPPPASAWVRFDQMGLSVESPVALQKVEFPPDEVEALQKQGLETAYFRGANGDFFVSCSVTRNASSKALDLDQELRRAVEVMAISKGAKIQPFTIEPASVSGLPARGLRTVMVDAQGSLTVVGVITQSGQRSALVFFASPRPADQIAEDLNRIAASIRFQ